MTNAEDFFKRMYSLTDNPPEVRLVREDDEAATVTKMGARIAAQTPVKAGGVTKVNTNPQTKIDAKTTDGKGFGRSYDRNNRPNDHRPGSVDFPQQKGPTNVARNHHLTKMWNDSIEGNTKRSQRLQRPGQK